MRAASRPCTVSEWGERVGGGLRRMTATELMTTLQRLGAKLAVEGGRLRYRVPPASMSAELKSALSQHRLSLTSSLQGEPAPGVRLFLLDATGRACVPEEAVLWCWEGGT